MVDGCGRLAALDEVGRGALAGPVTVGAVVVTLDVNTVPAGLKDSKLLSPAARARLLAPIQQWVAEWAVGHAEPAEIDAVGIMAALQLAARRALGALNTTVNAVLLDGDRDYISLSDGAAAPAIPVHTRVKADRDCASVAAASVLAKTTRDTLMVAYGADYPDYQWAANKGYGTAAHRAALATYGPCDLHRHSWQLRPRPQP